MVHSWPLGHMHKNLKQEVLLNLIEERVRFATKLQMHLDKQSLCYRDAVLEINKCNNGEAIPEALGDFILSAISLTMKIPIFLIYPSVDRPKDVNDRTITTYGAHIEYLFRKDAEKARARTPDLVVFVYNGLDYYAPTAPKEIAMMTRNCTTASTHIEDAMDLLAKILNDLPQSNARDTLTKSLRHMRAANSYLEGTLLATGTTAVASLPVDVLIPRAATASHVMKTAHKRAAAALGEVPPEKRQNESDDAFAKRKTTYKEKVAKAAAHDTKLAENQCPCSAQFPSMAALLQHQANAHPDLKNWKCHHCPNVFNSKGHCWSHTRKQLGKFYFYCDCPYKDKKDLDANGKPKQKTCIKGFDELLYVKFHHETVHNVGRCSCRCDYCDYPQQSERRKIEHHAVCEKGPNKDGGPTHWCEVEDCGYSCHGASTLTKHMKTDHHEALGLAAPKQWKCRHCRKEFKSPNGFKKHDC